MQDLEDRIAAKRAQLDALRPLRGDALKALQKHYDVDLTYTSNAIEGNTLTLRETAEVIEHGITVGGKPLRDHLEALDHYAAVLWVREIAGGVAPVTEAVVAELHRRVVARSQPQIAGIYSPHPRRVAGSPVVFPNPLKVPSLMEDFGAWLAGAGAIPTVAFEAHFRLTAIHPSVQRWQWPGGATADEPDPAARRLSARPSGSGRPQGLSGRAGDGLADGRFAAVSAADARAFECDAG